MAEYVSQAEFARRIGVSRQYVGKLVKEGKLKKARNGKLDFQKAKAAIELIRDPARESKAKLEKAASDLAAPGPKEPKEPKKGGKSGGSGRMLTFAESKAMKEFWLAKRAKLDFERAAGTLLEEADTRKSLFEALRPLRESLLAAPGRMAGELAPLSDPSAIESRLMELVREALEEALERAKSVLASGS